MRSLILLLSILSTVAYAAPGYPVYSMLSSATYKVGEGTGFIVRYKNRSYIITNWHVCRNFKTTTITNDKFKIAETSTVVRKFPDQDLCVMTTEREDGLELGRDAGEKAAVYAAGYPQYSRNALQLRSGTTTYLKLETIDYGPGWCPSHFDKGAAIDSFTKQTVSTCKHSQKIMETTLEGTLGNSGSPVVNSKGQLVGIVHSRSEGQPLDDKHNTLNYVPVSQLIKVLNSL